MAIAPAAVAHATTRNAVRLMPRSPTCATGPTVYPTLSVCFVASLTASSGVRPRWRATM
jgi:hypothetical protein